MVRPAPWLAAIGIMVFGGCLQPADAEPRVIEHRYGQTVVDGTPERVVSLSFIGHDFVLALDVVPVALRYWYGDGPYGVWPWAEEALGEAEPLVIYGEIDIEQIALMEPDLIVGQWSGMSQVQYELLSRIAPTLPPAPGEGDFSTPWQVMTRQLGLALNRTDAAEAIIDDIETRQAELRAAHPEWAGQSVIVGWPPRLGIFATNDIRSRFLHDLGFVSPQGFDAIVNPDAFFVTLPQEAVPAIDSDLLVWVHTDDLAGALDNIVLRESTRAYREGREVYVDYELGAALSHSSPLSIHYALDRLIPEIEAAMDGDPATPVPSMAPAHGPDRAEP